MKNYFSAILLGSLFSCSLFPIGITDEPDTLIDCSSEPDVRSVEYESYDRAHAHYLIHLTWSDHAGNEWSQRGRLAKLKSAFHMHHRRQLMDLRSFDKKQIFYFLGAAAPLKTKSAMPRSLLDIFEYSSDDHAARDMELASDNASEINGAAENESDGEGAGGLTVEGDFLSGPLIDLSDL